MEQSQIETQIQIQKLVEKGHRALVTNNPAVSWKHFNKALILFNSECSNKVKVAWFNNENETTLKLAILYNTIWKLYICIVTNTVANIDSDRTFVSRKSRLGEYHSPATKKSTSSADSIIAAINESSSKTGQAIAFPLNWDQFLQTVSSNYQTISDLIDGQTIKLMCLFLMKHSQVLKAREFSESWLANLSDRTIFALENHNERNNNNETDENAKARQAANNTNFRVLEENVGIGEPTGIDAFIRQSYLQVLAIYCFEILPSLGLFDKAAEFLEFNPFIGADESKKLQEQLSALKTNAIESRKMAEYIVKQKAEAVKAAELETKAKEKEKAQARSKAVEQQLQEQILQQKKLVNRGSIPASGKSAGTNSTKRSATTNSGSRGIPLITLSKPPPASNDRNLALSSLSLIKTAKHALVAFARKYGLAILLFAIFAKLLRALVKRHGAKLLLAKLKEKLVVAATMATKITYL